MKKKIENIISNILEDNKEPTAGLIKGRLEQMGYKLSYDALSKRLNMMAGSGIIGRKTIRDFVDIHGEKHWGWHYYKLN